MFQGELPNIQEVESPELESYLAGLGGDSGGRTEELIPLLQRVQKDLGYLPPGALVQIAHLTGRPLATVFGVATFYAQFRFHPPGRHTIMICRGTACHVRGSDRILEDLQGRLGVAAGQTTADRLFSLETVACFGCCALAPVVVVDGVVHGRMSPTRIRKIQEKLGPDPARRETGRSVVRGRGGR